MSSQKQDLLGLLVDTALQADDDDPGFDGKGYTNLIDPVTDDASEENDDDPAFEGLLESGLSQQEAQDAVDYMKPLDEEEAEILDSIPLDGLSKVDDSEHDEWLGQRAGEGHKAMDRVFEDAIYGDNTMNGNEERMEREDVDSAQGFDEAGWGFRSLARGVRRGARGAYRGARKAGKLAMSPLKLVARFVPGRDKGKATLVRNLYKKLWFEHANWLAVQDKNSNIPLKPRADYETVAKLWAKEEMRKKKLPMQFATDTASGNDRAAALNQIVLGDDSMGAWFWPFSWFISTTKVVQADTADRRADAPPEEQQAMAEAPSYQNVAPPMDDGSSAPPPGYDDSQQGELRMLGWNDFIRIRGLDTILGGEDSLGAYATQILGDATKKKKTKGIWSNESDPDDLNGAAQPAKDNPHVDRIVKTIALKLKVGKPIGAGELGLLASAAKEGNANAQKVIAVLKARGAVVSGDESGLDPWLYKLSPGYWLRSKRSKEMKDIEAKKWKENAEQKKQLEKQQEDLKAAENAAQASAAVEAAKVQSAATEEQLKQIQASLKGAMSGSSVGHENVTPISKVLLDALEKTGKREKAGKLYAKVKAGQALDKDEQKEALKIAKLVGRMKVVHGDLIEDSDEALAMQGAFVGTCVMGGIDEALRRTSHDRKLSEALSLKVASGRSLSDEEKRALGKSLKNQAVMRGFVGSLVSGKAFGNTQYTKLWKKAAFVGAAKTMSDEDKKMLEAIVKLAKLGNPRAQKALAAMKKTGMVAGDSVGFGVKSFFKYATAPIWLPAKGIAALSNKAFGKGGSSPEQQRLAMMAAAAKRRKAFEARAAAADAQSEAEQRAQLAIADAADAEADAADAEALAKEQAMKTREVQADPSQASGEFVGAWTDFVGKGTKAHKIATKASENSATGIKIRAGAKLYQQYRAGDPKADKAIRIMAAKAKKGDPQALRDVNALKAGRIAVKARQKAQKKQAAMASREVRRKKSVAFQRGIEAKTANKLCQISRKRELKKHWKVERMAAAGHPKAKAYVAKQVAAAKKGDKKAKARVAAMQQGRLIRQKVRTPRDLRNMRQAERFCRRLKRNDPKAMRQYRILQLAANKGDPNATRAVDRIMLAALAVSTVSTGIVALPKKKKGEALASKKPDRKRVQQHVALVAKKIRAGTASREEVAVAAKEAHDSGDNKTAGKLANIASSTPSATEAVQKKAQQLNAAEAKNPEAQASLAKNLADAKQGDPAGIQETGKIVAAKTVSDVNSDRPVSPTMRDAYAMNERIKAGDPAAISQAREITAAATAPNPAPEATLAAAGLVAATVLDKTFAGKPKARAEFAEKVLPSVPAAEKTVAETKLAAYVAKANEGTISPSEGEEGVNLALRLRKPKLAADISSKAPPYDSSPLSSLPDRPLPPIVGMGDLLRATLQAFTFSTPDPLANYRGGIANRGKSLPAEIPISAVGWSPFDWFKRNRGVMPIVAAISAPVAAAASIASLMQSKKAAPAPVPAPVPAAPTPSTDEPVVSKTAGEESGSSLRKAALKLVDPKFAGQTSKDSDEDLKKTFKSMLELIAEGRKVQEYPLDLDKRQYDEARTRASKGELKSGVKVATLDRLIAKNKVKLVGPDVQSKFTMSVLGGSSAFQDLIAKALKDKKMSKDDFNKAVTSNLPSDASPDAKKASGEQVLKFLKDKNVAVGGEFVGSGKSFKEYVVEAVKAKKMSKDDFNKAIEIHCGPKVSKEAKKASGEKVLKFLKGKDVTVG